MLDIVIKKMAKEHIEDVYNVEKNCFSTPWSVQSLSYELENENAIFFVAVLNEHVVGYICAHCVCRECYICNIAVLPEHRKRKIATCLLAFFIDSFQKNCDFISLEVRKSNLNAIKLYENFGFKKVGLRKDFYVKPKEDAIIMTLYS